MNTRRALGPAGVVLVIACSAQSEPLLSSHVDRKETPIEFASDLWPGEGIPVIEMQRALLPVYAEPDPASTVVDTLRGRVGERVVFDSTRYQTLTSGAITVPGGFTLTGRNLGNVRRLTLDRYYQPSAPETSTPISGADTIDFLQYRAEGTCFVRVKTDVIDAQPCPGFGPESVTTVRDPVTRWWVFVRGAAGAQGWIVVSDTTARAVRREF